MVRKEEKKEKVGKRRRKKKEEKEGFTQGQSQGLSGAFRGFQGAFID